MSLKKVFPPLLKISKIIHFFVCVWIWSCNLKKTKQKQKQNQKQTKNQTNKKQQQQQNSSISAVSQLIAFQFRSDGILKKSRQVCWITKIYYFWYNFDFIWKRSLIQAEEIHRQIIWLCTWLHVFHLKIQN